MPLTTLPSEPSSGCKALLLHLGVFMALSAASWMQAATITFDGGPGGTGTVLNTAANWSGDIAPTTSSEVLLNNSVITLPAQLTLGANVTWGDLVWNNNTTTALTLNTATTTNFSITLSGGAGSTEAIAQGGATGDLIVMGSTATGNTLSIGGNAGVGAGRLNMILAASGNFNVVNSGATLSISSQISGAFSLTKTGAGTLTLSGANSFSGGSFTLSSGTLNLGSATALGSSANTFVINDGVFDNTSGTALTLSNYKQTWNGNFTFTGSNNLVMGTGVISLGTAAGTSRTVTVSGGTLAANGIISNGTTATGIVKEGAGTLSLGGVNTFTGGVLIKNGTLMGATSTAFGTAAGTITLGDTGGTTSASLMGTGLNTITVANPIVVASGSTGNTLTIGTGNAGAANTAFSGTVSLGHNLVMTNAGTNLTTLSGVVSEVGGPRSITVNAGIGSVLLSNTNTFTGGVILNSGRLEVGTNGTGPGVLTIAGGLLDTLSTSSSSAATLNNSSYVWNADVVTGGSTPLTFATGNVVLSASRTVTTQVITAAPLTINGVIGDGGSGYSLTKAGTGTLNLAGNSTYSGSTIVTRGVLNLVSAGSGLANTSAVTVTGGTLNLGVASGTGVANRINAAATLTLGGSGVFIINAGATAPVNSQSFAALSVAAGSGQLSSTSVTNAGTFAFTGGAGSVYSRAVGGTLRILVGTNTSFTNAPTGAAVSGTGTSAILLGAVMGTTATATTVTDFVKAAAGVVSAPTYGTNTWGTGVNTTVTAPISVSGSTQSLRFNNAGNFAVTLTGTATLESGGILVTSSALAGGTITGGQIQAQAGRDLWVYTSTLAANPQGLTIASLITDNGGSSLTKTGGGALYLTNAGNTYAGGTFLGEGILSITSGGTLGAGALNFTGNAALQPGAAAVDLGTRAITISNGQTASFNTNGNTLTLGGVISGAGGLTKLGAGTLVLSGASTYSGPTAIENGTLKLDFSAAGAPVSDILPASSLFTPGGGSFATVGSYSQTILIQGKDNTANSQTFGGVYTNLLGYDLAGIYLNKGMTHLNFVAGAGGTLVVNVGAVTRGYSTDVNDQVDFSIGAGVTVNTTNAAGLLGGHATVNGDTWANVSGGIITGLATGSYSTSYSTASVNLDVGTGGTLTANPGTVRFNNSGAATVALGSVVRAITQGGLLVTPNVGANTSTISGGFLAGYSARDLMIHQNNTAGALQIDAGIVDVNARTMSVSKNGLGKVVLTASNTYAGSTYVNEGTLVATGDAVAAFTKTATATAGSAVLSMADTSGIFLGQSVTESTALTASSTWTVVAINAGVSVTLSNNANEALTGGTFTFSAGGAVGAAVGQYIANGATLQIGNGGTTGSLLAGQTLANNGTVVLNRSNDFSFANVISGTGALEKQGAGNATLTGAGTFTGDTRVAGGTLTLSTVATNLQSSTLDYNSYGGSLSFGSLAAVTLGGLKGGQNLALTNASAALVALTVGGNNQNTTYSGALSGLGSVSKVGGGELTLSGANTYVGTTSMTQGTLNYTGSLTGNGTTGIASSGGTLNLAGTFVDIGPLSVSGGVTNLSGSLTRTLPYATTANLTVSGGVFNVTGTLGTSAAVPLGQTAFSGNSITNFSGTEYLAGASATFRVAEGTSATVNVIAGTLTIGTNSGGVVLGRANASASGFLNVSGGSFVVTGAYAIRVAAGFADGESSGASVLTVSGTGVFDTGTTSGLFLFGSNLAGNAASTGTLNLDGGTLSTSRALTGGSVGASIINLNGGTFKATGTGATLATSLTTVNVRDGGAVIDSNGVAVSITKSLTHSTIVGDAATDGGLAKKGAGTLTLGGTNTYTGATTVNAGTLKAGSTSAFGSSSAVVLANTAGAALDTTGFNNSVGSLAGGGTTGGNVILGAATLTVGMANTSTSYAGVISGNGGGVVKAGTGTLTFTGVNTYTGTTVVNEGNLQVGAGGRTGAGATSVNGTNAVLSGSGIVQGTTTVILGQLRPGDNGGLAEGTLAFSSGLLFDQTSSSTAAALTIQGTTTANETGDRLSITGMLTLDSDSRVVVSQGPSWAPVSDQSWTLLDWSGVLSLNGWSIGTNYRSGSDADLNEGNLDLPDLSTYGLGWSISTLLDGSTGGALVITIVPEPSRALLLLVGLGTALLRRRRLR